MDKLQSLRLLMEALIPYYNCEMLLDEKMLNIIIKDFPNVYGIYKKLFGTVHGVLTNTAGYDYIIAIDQCPNGVGTIDLTIKVIDKAT